MKNKNVIVLATIVALCAIFSCSKDKDLTNLTPDQNGYSARLESDGYIYTLTNNAEDNKIVVYVQHPDGSIDPDTMISTGGKGSGEGLGSQGAVILNHDHTWLFAVNAGDNTISSFSVDDEGHLSLMDVESSHGTLPVSLTVHDSYLYVVNSMTDNIAGFMVDPGGMLSFIPGSNQSLSASGADPAQIRFRPGGTELLVTEKATNRLTYFVIDGSGAAGQARWIPSKGKTPFGFAFTNNDNVIVSNAEEGAEGASTVTSYVANGKHNPKKYGPVPNDQTAACWVAITHSMANQAYVTNTGSNTISTYLFDEDGQIFLQQAVATVAMAPTDIVVTGVDDAFVYAINVDSHSINAYSRSNDGSLTQIDMEDGLPLSVAGLAAFIP